MTEGERFDLDIPVPGVRRGRVDAYVRVTAMPYGSSKLFSEKKDALALYCALRYHGYRTIMRRRLLDLDNEEGWRVWKLEDR